MSRFILALGALRRTAALWVAALVLAAGALGAGGLVAATPPTPASARRLLAQATDAARAGNLDLAYMLANQAAAGQPSDSEFVVAREALRQRATLDHLQRAHAFELNRKTDQAAVEYRTALALDPSNVDARAGLVRAFPLSAPPVPTSTQLRVKQAAPPVEIDPAPGVRAFHLRTGVRAAVGQIAAAYGLRALVADKVPERPVRLDIADATFAQAMTALHDVAGVDWIPIDAKTLYFASSADMRQIEPEGLRTFYVPWVNSSLDLNEIATTLKSLLGIQQATIDGAADAISVRGTANQLDAAEQLLLDFHHAQGEVLLEIKILEVNSTTAQTLGLSDPDQFTMFALGPLLAQLQNSASLQQSILQLFEQGGLNAVLNSGQLSPTQLQQAQSTLSPLLQNPFVTFGGGATLMALSVPNFTASLTDSSGYVNTIESALLRASSGQVADLKIGQRYPIINASFAPISLNPAITQVLGNGSFTQPFPSFTYEDLGFEAKLTPRLSVGGNINLQIEITVKALTGLSSNNLPILSNRHLITAMGMKDNEPMILGGLLDQEETSTLAGLPGLSQIPGLSTLFSTNTGQTSRDQLVLMITAHVVQRPTNESAAVWLPAGFAPVGAGGLSSPGYLSPSLLGPGQSPTPPGGRGPLGPGFPGGPPNGGRGGGN